ncbi:hypothetical protein BZA77DRAFT_131925 [Pyronema omphalodes]|nr:hypothetical protein BZA77DRAFT_131925 [Pyronema omphalodes]
MQAPMQSSSSPGGLQVPSSFGARRSISHDLARFSLDLAPERRRVHNNKVPYPSPPMSHSPPPPNPPSPGAQGHPPQTAHYGVNPVQMQPQSSYAQPSYRQYLPEQTQHQQQQQHPQQSQPVSYASYSSNSAESESYQPVHPQLRNTNDRFAPPPPPPPPTMSGQTQQTYHNQFPPPPMPLRRPKSHVASACVNCKKAHLACDTRRPCPRCVGLGKQDTCVDVQHKKRGRPRLRDDHRSHSFEIAAMARPGGNVTSPSSPSIAPSFRPSTHRILKSQAESPRFSRRPSLTPREDILGHHSHGSYFDPRPSSRPSRMHMPTLSNATAFLTVDWEFIKSSGGIGELLGYAANELDCQKDLFSIVLETDFEKLKQLRQRIFNEFPPLRDSRRSSPNDLWRILPDNHLLPEIQGTSIHQEVLHMRHPDGQYFKIRIRAHLAYSQAYVVVVVFSHPNEMPPPLQLNSSAYASRLGAPTPGSGSSTSLQSPSFHLQVQPGPQSPYSNPGMVSTSPMESRPRTIHESAYPPITQYMNAPTPAPPAPSPPYYRNPNSPANLTPTTTTFNQPSQSTMQQKDLQLPPLQLPRYNEIEGRVPMPYTPDETDRTETPRRQRIGVKEMVE